MTNEALQNVLLIKGNNRESALQDQDPASDKGQIK